MIGVRRIPGPLLAAPHFGVIPFCSSGSRVYEFSEGVCAAFDVATESLLWTAATPGRPARDPRPRALDTAGFYRPRVYPDLGLVVHLAPAPEGGLWVMARRLETGATVWDTRIDLPPPERWTETEWLDEALSTEELHASLAALADRIVVVVQRTSRRTERWTAGRHFPLPPFDCGLQFLELDTASGRTTHNTLIDHGWVGSEQRPFFAGLPQVESSVVGYDWSTHARQSLLELPFKPHDVVQSGSRVVVAYADGRTPCVAGYDFATSRPLEPMRLARGSTQIKSIRLRNLRHGTLAQINETRLIRLADDLQPRYEVRVRPYVYDVALTESNVLLIGADGNGTNFFAFDDHTGATIRHEPKSGHPFLARCGADWLATHDDKGIACISADGTRWRHHDTTEPLVVSGVFGDRVWSVPHGSGILQLGLQYASLAGC